MIPIKSLGLIADNEIKEQIEARHLLKLEMIGSLYPSMLTAEIEKLKDRHDAVLLDRHYNL